VTARPLGTLLVVLALLGGGPPGGVAADPLRLEFVGAQQGRAKLLVDGRLYQLRPGESPRPGMTLLSLNAREVVLRIDEVTYRLSKGSRDAEPLPDEVVLVRDPGGMFVAEGEINGRAVTLVVDTGATWVAISSERARRIGLRYRKDRPVKVETASRVETAYLTTLETVRLGGIVRSGVDAIITPGKHPDVVLLGMSFLSGLSITHAVDTMTIGP
jgi:aspartyl protease family protein